MRVNITKSKVVHYRTPCQNRCNYEFQIGLFNIDTVAEYKYLGIILDEHLDFKSTSALLAESGGRALGAICNKFKQNKGFGYKTYTHLYACGVTTVSDYCSGVWGFQTHEKINTIQNRAARYFLGVHRFTSNLATSGDIGWVSSNTRRKVNMIRLWNRLLLMEDSCLAKKIFVWDKSITNRNWSAEISKILDEIGLTFNFVNNITCNIQQIKELLHNRDCNEWRRLSIDSPKLRTYVLYKQRFGKESYVSLIQNRKLRSILSQFRCGVLPLHIETGRYVNTPVADRLCLTCNENQIEDEKHLLFKCSKYNLERNLFEESIRNEFDNYDLLSLNDKLCLLMNDKVILRTAFFIEQCMKIRNEIMYINS